jgi:hypothetical protein
MDRLDRCQGDLAVLAIIWRHADIEPPMNAPRHYGTLAIVFGLVAISAAWDSPAPQRPSHITVLYVGAADCAPCRSWQRGDGALFRETGEFAQIIYREVKSPTLRDVLKDEHWPSDLRDYRDRLGPHAGVPLWLVIGDQAVIATGLGESQWRDVVLPRIRSLVR